MTGEQIGLCLTCGNGRRTFSRWVHRSAVGAAGMPSAAGESAWEVRLPWWAGSVDCA